MSYRNGDRSRAGRRRKENIHKRARARAAWAIARGHSSGTADPVEPPVNAAAKVDK